MPLWSSRRWSHAACAIRYAGAENRDVVLGDHAPWAECVHDRQHVAGLEMAISADRDLFTLPDDLSARSGL
jgi:hypothetical protein